MKLFSLTLVALLAFAPLAPAQSDPASKPETTPQSASQTAAAKQPKVAVQEAPGGGPDKVWVNTNSSVYHCPGDRFYGKTAHGRYMTEPAAKAAGGHGVGNKTCFAGK